MTVLGGTSLLELFQRRPRIVYYSGPLYVWDNQRARMVIPEDAEKLHSWLLKMHPKKELYVYHIRVELVAEGPVKDVIEWVKGAEPWR